AWLGPRRLSGTGCEPNLMSRAQVQAEAAAFAAVFRWPRRSHLPSAAAVIELRMARCGQWRLRHRRCPESELRRRKRGQRGLHVRAEWFELAAAERIDCRPCARDESDGAR